MSNKVLIIEDNKDLATIIESKLSEHAIESFLLLSGVNVLQTIEDVKPDLIILDMQMPDVDGLEVLKILQNNNVQIPVIVASNYENNQADLNTIYGNIVAIIVKADIRLQSLVDTIIDTIAH